MQSLAITSTGGTAYTAQQMTDLINFAGGSRRIAWRVDLLNADRSSKQDITPFCVRLSISHDSSQPIHRTLTLDMVETVASQTASVQGATISSVGINYLFDIVVPYCRIGTPDGGWAEFPQGYFKFKQPGAQAPGYAVVRHAELSDLTYLVSENEAIASNDGIPLLLPEGNNVLGVIYQMVTNSPTDPTLPGCGISPALLYNWPSQSALTATISPAYTLAEGTNYLDEINKLLGYLHCYPLWVDELGRFRVTQWPFNQYYSTQPSTWTFDTENNSIILPGLAEEIETDQVKNIVQVIVEDASRTPFYAVAKNLDQNSPYNIAPPTGATVTYDDGHQANLVGIGPRVDVIHASGIPDATDQNWAQGYANQMLNFHAFLTDKVTLPCAVVPLFQDYDIVSINVKQHVVAAGAATTQDVVAGIVTPGLVATERFQVQSWQIEATLPSPDGAKGVAGAGALTTLLEPHNSKSGHTMSLVCTRVTSIYSPGVNNANVGTHV